MARLLARRLMKIERSVNGYSCPACGLGAGPPRYVIVPFGQAPTLPDTCARCGRRLVIRLVWPENQG
jgi:predicted RNA-binding Zn-ribbon protein involved in translation (DUF1610 family)